MKVILYTFLLFSPHHISNFIHRVWRAHAWDSRFFSYAMATSRWSRDLRLIAGISCNVRRVRCRRARTSIRGTAIAKSIIDVKTAESQNKDDKGWSIPSSALGNQGNSNADEQQDPSCVENQRNIRGPILTHQNDW